MHRFVPILSLSVVLLGAGAAWAVSPCCKAFEEGDCASPTANLGPRGCQELGDGNCVGGGVFDDGGRPAFAGCVCLTLPPPQKPGCVADTTTMLFLQGRRGNPSTNDTNPSNGDAMCSAAAARACKGLIAPQ